MFGKRRILEWLTCASLLSVGFGTAEAHHSFAMFDQQKCQKISGAVVEFQLKYPHAWLWILTADGEGKGETWAFESGDPSSLRLRGWSTALLKKGEKVTVIFNPLKDGRAGGSLKRLQLANGQVLQGPYASLPGEPRDCSFEDAK